MAPGSNAPGAQLAMKVRKEAVVVWVSLLVLLLVSAVNGERLPIKAYTTADGLAHDVVNRIVPDSRGFLWFCTREGLSRFDGYGFTNYGLAQGLPSAIINNLLETREGVYWVATTAGLCRFDPLRAPRPTISSASDRGNDDSAMFTVFLPGDDAKSKHITSLLQDRGGVVWCGTLNGVYRLEDSAGKLAITSVNLGIPDHLESKTIECLLEDRLGTLWVGSHNGLYRRWPDGRVEAYSTRDGLPDRTIRSLLEDREGRIWVGTRDGWLCRMAPDPVPGRTSVARAYTDKDGLPTAWINQFLQSSDGTLWAGSSRGLIQFVPTADGRDFRFRAYGPAQGLSHHEVEAVCEDRNRNLWLAMAQSGADKIARGGFTSFGRADGFSWNTSIFESRAGEIVVLGGLDVNAEGALNRYDGEKFFRVSTRFPETVRRQGRGWGWNQTVLEDHTGEWWIGTRSGVCRYPRVAKLGQLNSVRPKAIYTTRDGLASDVILRLFEDSRGDIWVGSVGEGRGPNGLSRWQRSTGAFRRYAETDNLPGLDSTYVSSFAEDKAGDLWIGFNGESGLARYRDGRFTRFKAADGVPAGQIRNTLVDSKGRLWLASYRGGLCRVDDPAAERPRFVTYTTADGLSSNEVTSISEDKWGRIYVSTGRGIDKLDTATGRIKHYTTADGLPVGETYCSLCDHSGALWFSVETGVVKLVPEPDQPPLPPPILITALRVGGVQQHISALGEVELAPIELSPDKNQLQIDFVALGFSPGEGLRYQYKLEGASDEWSPLADQRGVNFANLAPGSYRFMVRASNADDVMSENPASLKFRVLTPVWRRWWFIAIVALLAGGAAYALYSYRLTHLLELERVRTRIAADLHDDIGSSLSQIAVLSEVLRRKAGGDHAQLAKPLAQIAHVSREAIDSMSDIVWAINPQKDHLRDLAQRMRRHASEVFPASDIQFTFQAEDAGKDISLGADLRRQVFLIFKESVNNIIRHSGCDRAGIHLSVEGPRLVLEVTDNGHGFDVGNGRGGNGLVSMRRRAASLGAEFHLTSRNGTTITIRVPHGSPRG